MGITKKDEEYLTFIKKNKVKIGVHGHCGGCNTTIEVKALTDKEKSKLNR